MTAVTRPRKPRRTKYPRIEVGLRFDRLVVAQGAGGGVEMKPSKPKEICLICGRTHVGMFRGGIVRSVRACYAPSTQIVRVGAAERVVRVIRRPNAQ